MNESCNYSNLMQIFYCRLFKTKTRNQLPLHSRDRLGLNALERLKLRQLNKLSLLTAILAARDKRFGSRNQFKLHRLQKFFFLQKLSLLYVPQQVKPKSNSIRRISFNEIIRIELDIGVHFRFTSISQLKRLLSGFGFPTEYIKIKSYRFHSEEIIIIGLLR